MPSPCLRQPELGYSGRKSLASPLIDAEARYARRLALTGQPRAIRRGPALNSHYARFAARSRGVFEGRAGAPMVGDATLREALIGRHEPHDAQRDVSRRRAGLTRPCSHRTRQVVLLQIRRALRALQLGKTWSYYPLRASQRSYESFSRRLETFVSITAPTVDSGRRARELSKRSRNGRA